MIKKCFFFKKMHFFCLKYLLYKEFFVTLRSHSELETNNSLY